MRPVLPALFALDADLKPHPDLAAAWPRQAEIALDPFTVTVRLRRASWSDGKPITAKDVRFSWTKLKDGPTGYRYRFLRDVEVTGTRTLRLHFDRPVRRWWSLFSIDDMVLPEHAYSPDWATTGPTVAGGPFAVTGWVHGLAIKLRRNPLYFGHAAPLAGIDVTFVQDDETRLQLLRKQQLDGFFAEGESNIGRRSSAYGFKTVDGALAGDAGASGAFGPTWWELDLDPTRLPAGVAQAVLQAVHPTLAAEILEDSARPMNGIPPDFTTKRATPEPWKGRGSLAHAKELLDSAHVRTASPRASFQLVYPRSNGAGGLATFIHFRLQEIGLAVELDGLEPDTFDKQIGGTGPPAVAIRLRRGADAPDAAAYASDSSQPGSGPVVDQVTDALSQVSGVKIRSQPVVGVSGEPWAQAQAALVHYASAAPLVRVRSWIVGRDLGGAHALGTAAGPLWNAGVWTASP